LAILAFFVTGSYQDFHIPTDYRAFISVGFAVFFYGMFERNRFHAAKLLEASVLTIITNISAVVAFIGAAILYSEPITSEKLVGSLLILISLFMATYDKSIKNTSKKGILIGIFISIMLGFAWMLDKNGTMYFNSETYSIFVWVFPLILICFPKISIAEVKLEFKGASWRIWLLALLNVVGYIMQLKAFSTAEATTVIPILQISTLLTVILGMIFLKERDRVVVKLSAGILAVAGTAFLV
jgi:drug/metabolite transporter (DMT)-like permease